MSVTWRPAAIADRMDMLDAAESLAYEKRDPQIFVAALAQDLCIEDEGSRLDGVATWQNLPGLLGTHVYAGRGGYWVLLYRRTAQGVEIERVRPSRTNWKP
ncbi:plasmid stabilization protein [Rhodanobacter sp. 115]|uniref:hypothetical protein n=1 Tax=Rhodanobacter sp. FW021-MT20 TaxID=1162282 RepID=UPI000260D2FF|nr:hypothetical protein [Rhodanobacter sp. 115]EIL88431.1 hypothetical protein UU5_17122 [Rhodanobacter sp. 115]